MRLVHTADWHLGQNFSGFSREPEHARFLAWLLDRLEDERADALLICGDVFDQGNPPATAQARYYRFLAEARARMPRMSIVVIAGNHDAAPRIDAPAPILGSLGVHVRGAVPRAAGDGGVPDPAQCVVPLWGASGGIEAWCAAVPFLRVTDLGPQPADVGDVVIDGAAGAYARALDAARAQGLPMVALGHCHMQGGVLTDESERPIFGNAHALPASIFPDDVSYAALGHLHFAQSVGGRENIRYSGSPIPLSMTERGYRHQITVVDIGVDRRIPTVARALHVPRMVNLIRVPEDRAPDDRAARASAPEAVAPLDEVLDQLRELPFDDDRPEAERPFLEVRVRLDAPCPELRARVEQALEGKAVRLVRVHRALSGSGPSLADVMSAPLAELCPVSVLERLYRRSYGGDVPGELRAAYHELLDAARAEDANASAPPSTVAGGVSAPPSIAGGMSAAPSITAPPSTVAGGMSGGMSAPPSTAGASVSPPAPTTAMTESAS